MSDENKVQIEWEQCCVAQRPRNISGQTPIQWEVNPELFGKRYHEERTKHRLSHEQVREKIMDMMGEDVSVSYLQEIEQGKCNSREWCHYLAKVFDVCPEYFAGVVDFRWITREKAHNSVYPEKQTEEKLIKAISFEDELRPSLQAQEKFVENFVEEQNEMTWQKSKGQQSESIYADVFYRLAYATPEEQKSFMDLWELQKQYVKNREKDQRKEDELRKSLTKKYTLHKENPEIEKRIGYAFYKLAKENEGLFKVLYEVASDSNSRAQFQTIMMRNYQYKEWND